MTHFLFLATSLLHALWGVLILCYPSDVGATPLAFFRLWVPVRWVEGLVYLGAAALASCLVPKGTRPRWLIACAAPPQQILLLISSASSLYAVLVRHYADLVPRPWPFILADQAPILIFTLCHSLALLLYYRHGGRT